MLRHIVASGFIVLAIAGPAAANGKVDVAACKAMQAALVPRQAEIAKLTENRAAAATEAEDTGLAWEDAEIHRLVSPAFAKTADDLKASYESAKEQLARDDLALQSAAAAFNSDVATFNTRCVKG
jgi:hypothetical protein